MVRFMRYIQNPSRGVKSYPFAPSTDSLLRAGNLKSTRCFVTIKRARKYPAGYLDGICRIRALFDSTPTFLRVGNLLVRRLTNPLINRTKQPLGHTDAYSPRLYTSIGSVVFKRSFLASI